MKKFDQKSGEGFVKFPNSTALWPYTFNNDEYGQDRLWVIVNPKEMKKQLRLQLQPATSSPLCRGDELIVSALEKKGFTAVRSLVNSRGLVKAIMTSLQRPSPEYAKWDAVPVLSAYSKNSFAENFDGNSDRSPQKFARAFLQDKMKKIAGEPHPLVYNSDIMIECLLVLSGEAFKSVTGKDFGQAEY